MSDNGELTHFNLSVTDSEGQPLVLRCSPDEVSLYFHSPQFREVDHIYHVVEDTDNDQIIGTFIWRHLMGEEAFNEFSQAMVESGNWEYHYRPVPLDQDMESFAASQIKVPDTLPTDFS